MTEVYDSFSRCIAKAPQETENIAPTARDTPRSRIGGRSRGGGCGGQDANSFVWRSLPAASTFTADGTHERKPLHEEKGAQQQARVESLGSLLGFARLETELFWGEAVLEGSAEGTCQDQVADARECVREGRVRQVGDGFGAVAMCETRSGFHSEGLIGLTE